MWCNIQVIIYRIHEYMVQHPSNNISIAVIPVLSEEVCSNNSKRKQYKFIYKYSLIMDFSIIKVSMSVCHNIILSRRTIRQFWKEYLVVMHSGFFKGCLIN